MRGAVSVALIYRYFDPHGAAALDGHRSTLITTTLLLVLFSTMVLGGLTKPLLDYIQGPAGSVESWELDVRHGKEFLLKLVRRMLGCCSRLEAQRADQAAAGLHPRSCRFAAWNS